VSTPSLRLVSNGATAPSQLSQGHAQQLADSAIDPVIIAERGYQSISPGAAAEVIALAGPAYSASLLRTILHQGALAFPIYRLGTPVPYTWVLRPELPRLSRQATPISMNTPRARRIFLTCCRAMPPRWATHRFRSG